MSSWAPIESQDTRAAIKAAHSHEQTRIILDAQDLERHTEQFDWPYGDLCFVALRCSCGDLDCPVPLELSHWEE